MQAALAFYWGHVFYIAALVLAAAIAVAWRIDARLTAIQRLTIIVAPLILAAAAAHWALYLVAPSFADYGEPVPAVLGGNVLREASVYADWTKGQAIVGSNYGPLTFLLQALAIQISPTILASKAVGVLFAVIGLWALFLALKSATGDVLKAVRYLALGVILLAFNQHYWFWDRPDTMLIALVALGALAFQRLKPAAALVTIAVLAALATNFKLFGSIYLLPLAIACLVALGPRRAAGPVLIGGCAFVALVAAPFALPAFAAESYIGNLLLMPHQGLIPGAIYASLVYGLVILAAPLALATRRAPTDAKVLLGATIVVGALTAFIAGKPGGGVPYMMPLAPLSMLIAARLEAVALPDVRRRPDVRIGAVMLAAACLAAPIWAFSGYDMARDVADRRAVIARADELRDLFRRYPDAEMGHSTGRRAWKDEYLRVQKAYIGQPVRFDFVNYADQRGAGVPISVVYPLFEGCSVKQWVFSSSGEKLSGEGYGKPLFDDAVRGRFYANYRLAERAPDFEVWTCREPAVVGAEAASQR